jgi:peptidylprolyl isomerase
MDYNHRFAGKIILYDVNILKELKSDEEKIPGILKRHLPVKDEEISFNKNGKIIDITIPKEIFRAEGLHLMKHFIQSDIFKFTTTEKINFIETHEKLKTKPKEKISTDTKKELETAKKT